MSAILPVDNSLRDILISFNQGDVVVLHCYGTCTLIFHKCITAHERSKINIIYRDVGERCNLLGKNGWEQMLYKHKASECDCKVEGLLRRLWAIAKAESVLKDTREKV